MENSNNKLTLKIILVPIVAFFVGVPLAFLFLLIAGIFPSMISLIVEKNSMHILSEILFIFSLSLISLLSGYFAGSVVSKSFPKWVIFLTVTLMLPVMGNLLLFAGLADNPNPETISRIFWIIPPLPFYLLGLIIHYYKKSD